MYREILQGLIGKNAIIQTQYPVTFAYIIYNQTPMLQTTFALCIRYNNIFLAEC